MSGFCVATVSARSTKARPVSPIFGSRRRSSTK